MNKTLSTQFNFPFEISKAYEDKSKWIVEGLAATSDFDLEGDVILPEALKKAVKDLKKNSTVFFNHDRKRAIGKILESKFTKTKTGAALKIKVLISKTAPDIWQQIKEGVLNKFSIAAKVLDAEKKFVRILGKIANVIKSIYLLEASLVCLPANPKARAVNWYVTKALKDFEGRGGLIPMKEEILNLDELEKQLDEEENGEEGTEDNPEESTSEESGSEETSEGETEESESESEEEESSEENEEEKEEGEEEEAKEETPEGEGEESEKKNKQQNYPYPYPYPPQANAFPNSEVETRLKKIFFVLDKLIQGTSDKKSVPVLQELKGIISHMFGGTYPYPSPYPYPKPKGYSEKKLRQIARDEAVKIVNLRKGLTEVKEELETTSEKDPSDNLRNILSKME